MDFHTYTNDIVKLEENFSWKMYFYDGRENSLNIAAAYHYCSKRKKEINIYKSSINEGI